MNKAFRRSLLSLTAASAMTSSAFAGNAAYLDVVVNYLNPAMNTVILGIDDDAVDNKQRDRVEILIAILDKDGNYADKTNDGKSLTDIVLKRNNTEINTSLSAAEQENGGILLSSSSGVPADGKDHLKLFREMERNRNISRFVLDYSTFVASKLEDTIEVQGGGISKDVVVKLSSIDAKGLIVRATNYGALKATSEETGVVGIDDADDADYLNENFTYIDVTNDNNLSVQSSGVPSGIAGGMIPIRVYASTIAPVSDSENYVISDTNVSSGKFTLAPNLEGKTIIVQAMADYEIDGNASTMLNSIELVMKNGIAFGEIKISQGLPGTNSILGINDGVQPHPAFGTVTSNDGLGVTFVAYVKDDMGIANLKGIDLDDSSTLTMSAENVDTDQVVVRSKDPKGLKVGQIYLSANSLADLWEDTATTLYLMDLNSTVDYNRTQGGQQIVHTIMTVVDDLGNPALVSEDATAQYRRWGNDSNDNDSAKFNVRTDITDSTGTGLDFNGSDEYDINGTLVAFDSTIPYRYPRVATIVVLSVGSKGDNNGSATETLHVSYSDGSLSGMDPVDLKFVKVEALKSKISGNPILADLIDINTSTVLESDVEGYSKIIAGLEPLGGIGSDRGSANIFPEFKAKLKVVAIDSNDSTDSNATMTLRLTIEDPEKAGDFTTGDYFVYYGNLANINYAHANLGFKLADNAASQTVRTALVATSIDITGDFFEFNVTGLSESNISVTLAKGGTGGTALLAQMNFGSFTDADIKKLKGNSVNITFKAYDSLRQEVYAEAYFETAEEPIGANSKESVPAGSVLKIKFSGEAAEGDSVKLEFNSSTDNGSRVLLEGTEYDSNDQSSDISTTLGADKTVSIVLYDTNASSNAPVDSFIGKVVKYGLSNMTVNGIPVIYKTQKDDEDTDDTYEVGLQDLFYNNINIRALDIDGAAKVRFDFTNNTNPDGISFDNGSADGSEDEKQVSFTSEVLSEIDDLGVTSKPVTLSEEVETGLYYGFFGSDAMASVRDKYDKFVDTEEVNLEDNFVVECSSGLECSLKADTGTNTDSYILFKPEAAGTTQTITFKVAENEEIMNTISFSNIRKAAQNTKLMITREIGHATFNVVNSEVVVKIIGDGGKRQEGTSLLVISDNKDAKVKLVPLAVNNKFFIDALNSNGLYPDSSVNELGSYYFVTSDKPGKVTITATSTISKDDSDTNSEVELTGSAMVNFVAVDLDNPNVSEDQISAIPSGLSIKIGDANLDVDNTKILIKGINNDSKKEVEYIGNNTYEVKGMLKGTYQILIKAIDLAGNYAEADYVREITVGEEASSPADAIAKALMNKEYSIDGEFQAYDFKDGKSHLNWAYKNNATGKWYRLQGDSAADKNANPFGWKMVDIDPNTPKAKKWYMIKLTGKAGSADSAGKFGWAMISNDLTMVKKIASVKADGSFEYVNVSIKASMKDDKITFSK